MQTLPKEYQLLQGKKFLVTGAAGFLGGHLFRRLAGYGLDVIGTVWKDNEAEALRNEGFKSAVLDLSRDEPWDSMLKGVDIIFNIAALFQEVEQGAELYNKVNHTGALKLARTAADNGVGRFVHCSTVGGLGKLDSNIKALVLAFARVVQSLRWVMSRLSSSCL